MVSSDLEALVEMGFEEERAEIALKKSGGCMLFSGQSSALMSYLMPNRQSLTSYQVQGAIDWLEQNQDKSMDEIRAPPTTSTIDEDDANAEPPALKLGELARSLMCNECGKKLRSQAQAEFHASKTQHVDFAESTEEIAPSTEEEKKARLETLRMKLAEKRIDMSEQDKIDKKKNEVSVTRNFANISRISADSRL